MPSTFSCWSGFVFLSISHLPCCCHSTATKDVCVGKEMLWGLLCLSSPAICVCLCACKQQCVSCNIYLARTQSGNRHSVLLLPLLFLSLFFSASPPSCFSAVSSFFFLFRFCFFPPIAASFFSLLLLILLVSSFQLSSSFASALLLLLLLPFLRFHAVLTRRAYAALPLPDAGSALFALPLMVRLSVEVEGVGGGEKSTAAMWSRDNKKSQQEVTTTTTRSKGSSGILLMHHRSQDGKG